MNSYKEITAKSETSPIQETNGISVHGLFELTKPRLSLLSVFTSSLGFLVHYPLNYELSVFLSLTIGTALAAGGAAALNQWMEKDEDSLMERTVKRPIPSHLVESEIALLFGVCLSSIGLTILWIGTNPWACSLTLLTLIVYLLIYTPLKKRSPYATEIGAISGALPPLIGWVAASGEPSTYGWILFGILFTWQLPHFMAIAWNFREDYKKGGFKLQDLGNPNGYHLARKSLVYSLLLTGFVFSPYFIDTSQPTPGLLYFISACILSAYLLLPSFRFLTSTDRNKSARKLFFVTIIYLPLLFAVLVIDRFI
ncbi:MAG: protoheme IX farnesyltransferase [Opitutae bacterium]|nr:protoheme IX farnesyltransferase [Opitutae bacterium]MBT5715818.1 protoheme IX farnesyltransferase [Opitutae bacterium]